MVVRVVGDDNIVGLSGIKDVTVVGVVIREVVVGDILKDVDIEFFVGRSDGTAYYIRWQFGGGSGRRGRCVQCWRLDFIRLVIW